jgi:hypothetical protein
MLGLKVEVKKHLRTLEVSLIIMSAWSLLDGTHEV